MSKTIDGFAGAVAEGMNDQDRALSAFENALRHNPSSVLGLNAVASIARGRDDFDKAIEYFQRILNANPENGEVWGSMGTYWGDRRTSLDFFDADNISGHCLLMKDDLPKAYTSYQQALYHLANPKVSYATSVQVSSTDIISTGTQALVWYWYFVRSIWLFRTRRGGFLECPES